MAIEVPTTPQTTLVVLLGASAWPRWPDLDSEAFANSAREVRNYFLDPRKFHLPRENLLDLFDSDQSADDIDEAISQFLTTRITEMGASNQATRDVLVYFIGHAGFAEGSLDYYLAIRRTRKNNPETSGLRIVSLAKTVKENTRRLRRILILDCCYAASAFNAFQAQGAGLEEAARIQTLDAFRGPRLRMDAQHPGWPTKGTALLCSSSRGKPSRLGDHYTEFSEALLHVLSTRPAYELEYISLNIVADLVREFLEETGSGAPRPEVHSPDQREGDVADIPFFPNPRAQEERVRKVKEEQAPTSAPTAEIVTSSPAPLWAKRPSPATHLPTDGRAASQAPLPVVQRKKPLPSIPITLGSLPARVCLAGGRAIILALLVLVVGSGGILVAIYLRPQSPPATPTLAPSAYDQFVMKNGIQFGFDAAHSHFNPYERILSPATVRQLKRAWSAQTGGPIPSSPTVANGVVYVGSQDGKLYAFHAAGCGQSSCTPLWTASTGAAINSSPAVANSVVYVGSNDNQLYAFKAAGCGQSPCAPLWTAPTGDIINSSPTVANGVVYVGSYDDYLYAFHAQTGEPLWSAQTGGPIPSSPTVANGVVYVGSQDGKLYAFHAAGCGQSSCTPLWTASTGAAINSSSTVTNGVVYVGSTNGKLYAFKAAGCGQSPCAPLWTAPAGADINYSSSAVANGTVYVGSTDGNLYAFNATGCEQSSCAPLWTAHTRHSIDSSSPTVANGVVYVGSHDDYLYAFHAQTGELLWSAPTLAVINSTPAVANGVVYVGSNDGKLYAFNLPGMAS